MQTSFEHKVYNDGWVEGLSTTLDFIPVVGGVKNLIEGAAGYTMTGEKLTDQERINYFALGILTTGVDIFTLGSATGFIEGGKIAGKELTKEGIKDLGKYILKDSSVSIATGWGSQFVNEKLYDIGLSPEEIFAVHLTTGILMTGVNRYRNRQKEIDVESFDTWDDMKDAHERTVTSFIKENKPRGATHPRKWLSKEGTSLEIKTIQKGKNKTYQIWTYSDSTGKVFSGIKGIEDKTTKQLHHFATNKNEEYTKQFEEILKAYEGLSLEDSWNMDYVDPHIGRHSNEYHEFVLEQMRNIAEDADGDVEKFKKLFKKRVVDVVQNNPGMLYADFYKK